VKNRADILHIRGLDIAACGLYYGSALDRTQTPLPDMKNVNFVRQSPTRLHAFTETGTKTSLVCSKSQAYGLDIDNFFHRPNEGYDAVSWIVLEGSKNQIDSFTQMYG